MGDGFSAWQVLAVVGVIFAILEIFTSSFVLLPAGLAFLATALWSTIVPGWTPVLALLCAHLFATYALFYFLVWPRLRKFAPKSNASGMIGQIATVTEEISGAGDPGYVQLYGDSWRAVSDGRHPVGAKVTILGLDGNKVVVGPAN